MCMDVYSGLLAMKKDETLQFVTAWTELKGIMLSEIS